MGNAIAYRESFRIATVNRMSKGLRSFIERECPIYLYALRSNDFKLRDIVVKQFNESVSDRIFDNIYSILPYLECLRLKRIQNLNDLSSPDFSNESTIKLSCLPCKINDFLALCYFDTGCSISCITLSNAKKLNLAFLIDYNVNGIAVGFGCNRQIIGFLSNLPVQFGNDLLFNINFVVINEANADFILIGSDFMQKNSLKLDYLAGKLIFPKQIIDEYELEFMPTKPKERDLFFDLFKYEMLEHSRIQMQNYFNCPDDRTNESVAENVNKIDNQLPSWIGDKKKNRNTNLYIRMQINRRQVLALIDSGADSSKISENLAIQLDILRFIDYDKAKISRGLGSILSIGRIPPIPITIYESDLNNNDENLHSEIPDARKTVLFVPFEVIKENSSPNLLLLGSDFLTYYGCCLDFETKSIDIPLNLKFGKYNLLEQDPKSISFLNSNLDINRDNLSNEHAMNAFEASSAELKEVQLKIQEKEHSHQLKKKLKRYKIELNKDEFDYLRKRRKTKFKENDNLYLRALNALNLASIKEIVNNLSELDEQTSIFLDDDEMKMNDSVNQLSKNQASSISYLDSLTDQDSIINVKFGCYSSNSSN